MMHTAKSIDEAFTARFAQSGTIPSLSASADVSEISAVGVTSFQQVTDTLVWVRVIGSHGFRVSGSFIGVNDLVQLKKGDANLQVSLGRAEFVSDADVAKESAKGKGK